MFESIKIYKNEKLDLEGLLAELYHYGYEHVQRVAECGDFSRHGEVVSIFPVTFSDPIRLELKNDTIEKIRSYDIETGRAIEEHNAVIILPLKGIHKKTIRSKAVELSERSPIDSFVDIEPGNRVVHVEHGIGIYRGVERHKQGAKIMDNIVIEYAEGDKLYVPFSDINLVQKYIGFEKKSTIHKLGGKLWKRAKLAAQKGINNLALELLELAVKREAMEGFQFSKDADWQKELEGNFPFKETPDQAKAAEEVKGDMEKPKPMDRLICGDVGYGKTEVALRAAFKAVMDNKQVAMLVPTTILAEQHYNTFTGRMKKYPVSIAMLSRFNTGSEQKRILQLLKDGKIDIVIGTHRLLSLDVGFKDLGLVIIDEEQRFGVKHKETLKKMRLMVDVLTMTATPIPRTLYMSLMSAKDMSQLETPPQDRLPIKTTILRYDEGAIKEAIEREVSRKGQVYFVTNRIRGIEKIAYHLEKLCRDARINVAHGQMPPRALESAMLKFIKGDTDVLLSTAIIESGIDIPNANTIIINNADRFGLADLYQLRGRVGRFKRQAYAYLVMSKEGSSATLAQSRLDTIHKFTALGSGFRIAMKDLEMRGAGNILGSEQHGYINSIGFDLYCRLLKGAVSAYKKTLRIGA
ncbi:MAG: transcription-repair coupling factor [Candidatus Omnitrophica bacterium]|nr:transcription-repair coupling factor [Candidatus Omnitrophota bacterium]